MNNITRGWWVPLILAALVVAVALTLGLQHGESGSGVLQSLTMRPTPRPPTKTPSASASRTAPEPTAAAATSSSTPEPSEFGTPPAVEAPSVTPLPISKVIDLAPELPQNEKAEARVKCPDGTYQIFLIRPDMSTSELPLEPGCVVIRLAPPGSLMGHALPTVTVSQASPVGPHPETATPAQTPVFSPIPTP